VKTLLSIAVLGSLGLAGSADAVHRPPGIQANHKPAPPGYHVGHGKRGERVVYRGPRRIFKNGQSAAKR
jgi:hypothetical protein